MECPPVVPDELDLVTRVTRFYAVDTDGVPVCRVTRPTPVEVVHRETCITGDLVQALATRHSLFHHVLITENLVVYKV